MLTQFMHKKETILFKNFIALLIESLTTDSQKQHLQDKHSGWISALAENRSQVPGLVKTKHEKKKKSPSTSPYQVPWSSFVFLFYPYPLEATRKETAEECRHSYAMLSIDCHFRNAYRKVKQLGMSPPTQQHQELPSSPAAPLPCSCIPVYTPVVIQINKDR